MFQSQRFGYPRDAQQLNVDSICCRGNICSASTLRSNRFIFPCLMCSKGKRCLCLVHSENRCVGNVGIYNRPLHSTVNLSQYVLRYNRKSGRDSSSGFHECETGAVTTQLRFSIKTWKWEHLPMIICGTLPRARYGKHTIITTCSQCRIRTLLRLFSASQLRPTHVNCLLAIRRLSCVECRTTRILSWLASGRLES
jgi:hypothetical protein